MLKVNDAGQGEADDLEATDCCYKGRYRSHDLSVVVEEKFSPCFENGIRKRLAPFLCE